MGRTQLILLAGVFLSGAASGAVALSLTEDSRRPERPQRTAHDEERGERLSLEELREALERLGVRVDSLDEHDPEPAPLARLVEEKTQDAPSELADTSADFEHLSETGSSAGDILARLEAEYRARLAEEKTRLAEEDARRLEEEAERAREARRAEETRLAEEARLAALTRAEAAAPPEKSAEPAPSGPHLAKNEATAASGSTYNAPVYNGPVHNGDRVTNEVNQVALYQSLFLYPGAVPNGPAASQPSGARPPQAGRHRSAHEDSPWRPTDYSMHYSNPFGSTFSR